ncbi:MAG: hypothetical protein PVF96_04770 [Candidatus Bathyarchaeota archaeon]|jgi:hypothetical protein
MSRHLHGFFTIITLLLTIVSLIAPSLAIDYLEPGDFEEDSWDKTVDYLEYVDVYAAAHGKPRPPAGAHAYLYMTYVNHLGLKMLYAGLSNITMGLGKLSVTLPIQTFMIHYKTENQSRDVVAASSYIMLLAYNETGQTIYNDSPDRNDTLYASFSMGFDLSNLIQEDTPTITSETKIIPLTHPDENTWHWGMTYTNLTAIWWRVNIDPENATYTSIPVAVSVYEELTFTYDLIFNPNSNNATIRSNYVIGRMTDLWVVDTWWWIFPVIVHYNSTGCYRLDRTLYSNETIYQFLHKHGISMSIVLFQASALLDQTTISSVKGEDIAENEKLVSNNTISTFTNDGEKIYDTDFGSKNTYTLHNFTSDTTETYNTITRTVDRRGFTHNPVLHIHTFLMRYIPLALVHMDPPLFEKAKNRLLNMTYADYFYIISYPTYDGYKIVHDPTHTVYLTIISNIASNPLEGLLGLIFLLGIITAIVAGIATIVKMKRKPKNSGITSINQPL